MTIEIKAPAFPESVADGVIATWHKQPGEHAERDELLVDIETDKVVLEVVAPTSGKIKNVVKAKGETVLSGEVIGVFEESHGSQPAAKATSSAASSAPVPSSTATAASTSNKTAAEPATSPAVRKLLAEHQLSAQQVPASGKEGRITKEDVENYVRSLTEKKTTRSLEKKSAAQLPEARSIATPGERPEQRVPMTRLRARVAERLLEVKQNTAMLTTFNEIDMKPVMDLRQKYRDTFEKTHGIKLGFMGLFVKASVEALKRFPAVNASIDGQEIVYHGFYDVSVAVSTDRGLVVPVIRDADQKSVSALEKTISDYALKARDGKLTIEDMTGGTFTITNGGTFGSLLSTPILNSPQTAILGMHKIEERPVVIKGEIVARPMMYVALSYDHRLIDGKEAVGFLVTIKELLEDPQRFVLGV